MAGVFGGTKHSKNIEIQLDDPFPVFYGDSHEAEPVAVSGVVILNNPDHMNVRGIKIKLEGKWRVNWTIPGAPGNNNAAQNVVRDKGILVSEEQQFIPAPGAPVTTHRIAPGRHEWRFKFMLDPSLPESVEGLSSSFVVYNLTAEFDRGYMSKSLTATKHVRVVRTLSQDMTETVPFPYSNEDTWADKIKYHIYIPSRYYAFGSTVPVQFTLLPLRKGVRIGKIKMEVLERVGLETSKQGDQALATTLPDKVVASVEQHMPADASRTLIEETSGLADDSYHFQVALPLKKSLNACRQSVNTDHIKVHHNLKIYINIHNPDGHVSQLCLRNLIHLYISPRMRISEDQVLVSPASDPYANSMSMGLDGQSIDAPPTYGTHLLDQLYDDIDPAGYLSGIATPANFMSRNHSVENFASLLSATFPNSAETSEEDSSRSSSITDSAAVQLQTRLAALQDRRPSIPTITEPIDESMLPNYTASGASSVRHSLAFHNRNRGHSAHNSVTLSNAAIDPYIASFGQPTTPPHTSSLAPSSGFQNGTRHAPPTAFDLEALTRIPSYNTAVRSPYHASPHADELPSYDLACRLAVPPATPAALTTPLPPTPPADSEDYSRNMLSRRGSAIGAEADPSLFNNFQGFTGRPHASNSNPPRPGTTTGESGMLMPPKKAHVRGRSVNETQPRERPDSDGESTAETKKAVFGAGSLAGLWHGMRRGSH
ncbi:hypothetical protein BT63DRAFT_413073 [Microthyrium microscopicum]|uniref:Arrestin C-terminal-like domain-containing protein n=1 Tax=Microthyrium microscopicum TaxID=703497 RepID=A0A6A6UFV6_9PEZI|nr:hypothetical protein BT63DRAFT_413073 [Microthyrium microscopicum]